MTDVPLDDFLREVTPYMPSVPDPVAINAVRNALIEFCGKSHWWLAEHDALTVLADTAVYDLDAPADAQVIRVHQAWFQQVALRQSSEDELHRMLGANWFDMTGSPRYISQLSFYEVRLTPIPDTTVADGLKMLVCLAPTRDATGVDQALYDRWSEQIGIGARARLHETPNTTYYDPKAAMYYRRQFIAAIGEAKVERNRGLTRASLNMRPAPGAV